MKAFDDNYRRTPEKLVCGIDEAGRGPLAGPVVAAAVVFSPDTEIEKVNDSKQLTEAMRQILFEEINNKALAVAYTEISHSEIDEINILQASLKAMSQSVKKLSLIPDVLLVDGNKLFPSDVPAYAIVKGDSLSMTIASASIIAKVIRDRIMNELDEEFPVYGWRQNKGYPTKEHINAILRHGPCKYHRKTFLRKIAEREKSLLIPFPDDIKTRLNE